MSDVSQTVQSAPSAPSTKTQGWSTRKTVTLALFTALSLILSFVEIAIFPAAPWLKYDPSGVVAAFATFAYGPAAGVIVGIVTAALHGLIAGDPWGGLMMAIVVICWVVPAGLIYKRKPTRVGALVALIIGAVIMLAGAIVANLIITPFYSGMAVAEVAALIVPVLLPFNILKSVINIVLTYILYLPMQKILANRK